MRRNRGEQDAIAKVPRSYEVPRRCRSPEEGQIIWSSGPQPSPSLQQTRLTQSRNQSDRSLMHALDGVRIRTLVVPCFLHRSSDQDAPIAARNQVYLRRADHASQRGNSYNREHLAFYGPRGKPVRWKMSSPGAGAVHHDRSAVAGFICANASHTPIREQHGGNSRTRGNICLAMLCRLQRSHYQSARINTAFFQIDCPLLPIGQRGLKFSERERKQAFRRESGSLVDMFGGRKQKRAIVAQINIDARLVLQFVDELGIHAGASGSQRLQRGWSFWRAVGQHASSGVRRFAPWFSSLYDQNFGTAFAQCDREREPYDPATDDDDVPSFHMGIVKERTSSRRIGIP